MSRTRPLALASGLLLVATGCSSLAESASSPPRPAARSARPAASPTPSPSPIALGAFTYADRGTKDVTQRVRRGVQADDFAFSPTFLRGDPSQKLTLRLRNSGEVAHNLSIPSQGVDVEIPAGARELDVEVTLPDSGALRFFCKLHADQGMNGQLLAGDAAPQPLTSAGFTVAVAGP